MNTDRTSCPEVLERLPLYVGGDLDQEALESVRVHLARCRACARRAGEAARARRAFVAALRAREADSERLDLWPGIRAALRAEGLVGEQRPATINAGAAGSARPRRLVRALVPLAAAAGLLALAQLGGWFQASPAERPGRVRPVLDSTRDAPSVVVTPAGSGGLRRVTLEDDEQLRRARPFLGPGRHQQGSFPGAGDDASLAGFSGYR